MIRARRRASSSSRNPAAAVSMRIEDWMKTPLHVVKPQDSVAHARALIEEYRIKQLPVVVNDKLVGIVTDRDLRDAPMAMKVSAMAAGSGEASPTEPNEIPVEEVMTDAVITLTPAGTLERAARLMRREHFGALPIVEKGKLVGILSRSDILDAFLALVGSKPGVGSARGGRPRPKRAK